MSYCKRDGKDISIFMTKEDSGSPAAVSGLVQGKKPDEDEEDEYGIILPNGEINWDCPCLGGMASGPCGEKFKDAFSCFHYSEEEEKGSDCIPQFKAMQECFNEHPEIYGKFDDDEDDDEGDGAVTDTTSLATSPETAKSSETPSSSSGDSKPRDTAV